MRREDSREQDAGSQREMTRRKCREASGMGGGGWGAGKLESAGEVNWRLKLDDMIQRDH